MQRHFHYHSQSRNAHSFFPRDNAIDSREPSVNRLSVLERSPKLSWYERVEKEPLREWPGRGRGGKTRRRAEAVEKEEEYDARGAGGGEGRGGTMCVHAAHVACQPAWQPGGLPSDSSSSLASKSEAPFPSPPLSLSCIGLRLARFVRLFSLLSLEEESSERERERDEEEGYLPFYQTAASYLEHSHPRPHLRPHRHCNR